MSAKLRSHLRSNVIGYLALFVAFSGSAYAATAAKNSVTSSSIKNGQVKTADLGNGAVTNPKLATGAVNSAKVLDGSLTNGDINSSLVQRRISGGCAGSTTSAVASVEQSGAVNCATFSVRKIAFSPTSCTNQTGCARGYQVSGTQGADYLEVYTECTWSGGAAHAKLRTSSTPATAFTNFSYIQSASTPVVGGFGGLGTVYDFATTTNNNLVGTVVMATLSETITIPFHAYVADNGNNTANCVFEGTSSAAASE